ncbi:hypothetical protein [Actinoallomurus sp. CA-142502]|uniref:hypothetical protein n=1 Tax=Actinoallomurus sp. CA-142502 TaxID=3239885 RepID=UPI003D8FD2A3
MTHPRDPQQGNGANRPSGRGNRHRPNPWLLPEDGIVDPVAVAVSAAGTRRVRLTPTERRLAAAHILAAGGTPITIARRLHISYANARTLTDQITTTASRRVA